MKKTTKIIYWVATAWLSLGMLSTGIVQLSGTADEVDRMTHLGYPAYLLSILGITKIAGVIAVLLPRLPIVKEWAYAGFCFTMCGAIASHIALGDGIAEIAPAVLLLVLTALSWHFRPESRKIATRPKHGA